MVGIGTRLRAIRRQWGLSLREVEERSVCLAQEWGDQSYQISASWLARVERGKHELTIPKLLSLAAIHNQAPEELLRQCRPGENGPPQNHQLPGPNTTLLLANGPLDEQARYLLPDSFTTDQPPEETTLLPPENDPLPSQYRRAIIGRRDRTLDPMIRAGAILKIDTQKRTIASRKEWTNEFDRPIYFLLTHAGYVCGWCELDKDSIWLTLVTHPLSHASSQRWRYRKEVEVIGRVVAGAMRFVA
ncbi:helix-turn-helix domain-containing protein [Granulicella sp. S156]|jgi:transcriptional regulator with XRE-family HTH domain|uniref:helix-turn-helix domain-containing protein n=1 Tax=Granulicella sp. S156 TaxID=1747224 RepID=UPI00131BA776|nr:helix-turn-helix transcriptional regulator [Granulicella sp. S156]